jgi:hypothetical protein
VCFSGITVEVSKYVLDNLFPLLCVSLTNQVLSFPPHDFIQRTTGFSKYFTVNDTEAGFKISVFNCNNVLFGTKTGLSKIQIENMYMH